MTHDNSLPKQDGPPIERDMADFAHLSALYDSPRDSTAHSTTPLSYWMSYPYTIIESALMVFVSALSYWLLRFYYFKWWHPERERERPRRMLKPLIHIEDGLEAMRTIESIALGCNAKVFWISGTLLGLERLGQPLPHDNDLDLGINVDDPHFQQFIRALWMSNRISSIEPQLISKKIQIQNPDLLRIPGGVIRYKATVWTGGAERRSTVKLDVFMHFPYRGGVMHGTRNSLWWNTTTGSMQKSYPSGVFSVPDNPHRYLTENYGNYLLEVNDFENSIDCPNVISIFSWRSLAYLLSRLQMMMKLGRLDRSHRMNRRVMATILKGALHLSSHVHHDVHS